MQQTTDPTTNLGGLTFMCMFYQNIDDNNVLMQWVSAHDNAR